jgi:hypothetical protein
LTETRLALTGSSGNSHHARYRQAIFMLAVPYLLALNMHSVPADLAVLESFFEQHGFAIVTGKAEEYFLHNKTNTSCISDPQRKFVLALVTKEDLSK